MNPATQAVANSNLLFVLCAAVILIVVIQAAVFLFKAWNRGGALGISSETRKKVITNSAVFSVVPSIPIIIVLSTLIPTLGMYLPWLRLSVVGSAMYENMAADTTVKTFGLYGISDPGMTPSIFLSVAWVMTLGVISYPLINALFLKRYTGGLAKMKQKGGFIQVAIPAMFVGLIGPMAVPSIVNFENPAGIAAIVIAGISVLSMNKIAEKTKVASFKEFSFPLSMVIGMVSAAVINNIFA